MPKISYKIAYAVMCYMEKQKLIGVFSCLFRFVGVRFVYE